MTDLREPESPASTGDVGDDFVPVDLNAMITTYLVRGETRDAIAAKLHVTRAEVDARIADATVMSEAEALNEREWIVRGKLRDLTRQASDIDLASFETRRLGVLLELAKLELALIVRARRWHGGV